ncbi:hypothetical protein CALVIDRAFT_308913 [Calocera viscosa TUFC12733]|uniref:Protein CPL1-like domain-containing protein n=1 Tax=Calocera viscosa (strain TUFC12733) TaxID=1330018 RepID=A0A167I6Z3_CALVF|nr:hypothetical protein CALVIDRAFT_308913 [Calocera viscosa TUFC12733]
MRLTQTPLLLFHSRHVFAPASSLAHSPTTFPASVLNAACPPSRSSSAPSAHNLNPSPSGVSRRGVQVNLPGSFSCPTGLTSCPIPEQFGQPLYERDMLEVPRMTGRTMHGECVDTMNDMDSCGGCATLGEGVQCGQVEGVRETACVAGKCQIFSCGYGYKLVMVNHPDGTAEQTCQRSLIGTLSPF